jgi:hypothetical protein
VLRLRRSAGEALLSTCSVVVATIVLVEGAFRCGRGGVASSVCFSCGFAAFGLGITGVASCACFGCGFALFGLGVGEVACSAAFGCGLLTGCVGAAGVASAADVGSAGGIVMAGFFVAGVCFEDGADCALAAGGSRRTGLSGPAVGVSAAAAGSAARDTDGIDSVAAKIGSR